MEQDTQLEVIENTQSTEVVYGRPTSYTPELADRLCELISQGNSLNKICKSDEFPCIATIFNWLGSNDVFLDKYTRAKEQSSEAMNEELMLLGDEAIRLAQTVNEKASTAVVQAVKLKADNMKWMMSKMKPKKYGDKVDMTSGGKAISGNSIVFANFKNNETETDS